MPAISVTACLILLCILHSLGAGFLRHSFVGRRRSSYSYFFSSPTIASIRAREVVSATSKPDDFNTNDSSSSSQAQPKGSQFGDISKFVIQRASSRLGEITGKDSYQFGDLSRWLDQQAKSGINSITGRKEYVFGDLTRWVDEQAKEMATNYTGKETYRVGDLSKEIVRRVGSGEYDSGDVFLALRVLVSAGVSLTPVASMLPVQVLMGMINFGLQQEIGGRVMEGLGRTLDERFKLALTGNGQYQLGDKTKKEVLQSLHSFIGKEKYEFGDIYKKLSSLSDTTKQTSGKSNQGFKMAQEAADDLSIWDNRFLASVKSSK